MPKIILCRGIQGSGKTTWAKKWAEEDPEHRVRWNNDDFRRMLGKYWVPKREVIVSSTELHFINDVMCYGYDIVIDNNGDLRDLANKAIHFVLTEGLPIKAEEFVLDLFGNLSYN